jgi:hypothetical protein
MTITLKTIDTEFISEEDAFLWLSRGDLKEDTETSGTGNKNIMRQNYYKQKQLANAYHVNNLMRQNTCHLTKEQYINSHDCVRAHVHCKVHTETGVKVDNEQGYMHVPKLAETSPEGKVTILRNQHALTEPSLTIHQIP